MPTPAPKFLTTLSVKLNRVIDTNSGQVTWHAYIPDQNIMAQGPSMLWCLRALGTVELMLHDESKIHGPN